MPSPAEHSARERGAPNVVTIVLDDLGFADLGCFGSEVETPHVDALAASGLRFNQFHVTAICWATRACLLTGRNHHAVGMGGLQAPFPGYDGRIPPSAGTLARTLRDVGYATFAVGKWHLTPDVETSPAGPFTRWPLGMGFDRYYGFLGGHTDQWAPRLVRDNGYLDPPSSSDAGYHLTEDLASQAIRMVQEQQQAAPGDPFFLYFAPGAVHWPHHVPSAWSRRYRGRYDGGWEVVRAERFARQQQLGVVPPGATLTDRPPWVPRWNDLADEEHRLFTRQMEVYAGFVSHTDAQIGRVVDFLERIDALDDTIIMVMSDNGASGDGGPHGALDNQTTALVNDAGPMYERLNDIGTPNAYNHYAWGWAWAGNTPFRLWKVYTWLGGVRVPFVLHWPAGVAETHRGGVRGQFSHAVDVMPTIVEAAGVRPPADVDGVAQQPVDGASLLSCVPDAGHPSPRDTQYFEMMGSRAIYHQGWKATTDHVPVGLPAQRELVTGSQDFDGDQWLLFDLENDFSESHNLAAQHGDRLRQLVEIWRSEADRNQVLPLMDTVMDAATERAMASLAHGEPEVFLPGGGPIWRSLAGGFDLQVDFEGHEELDGVLCAQGDWHGGWVAFVRHARLVITFHLDAAPVMVADCALGPGTHQLGICYRLRADGGATATVRLDGRQIGERRVTEQAAVAAAPLGFELLRLGDDRGLPVCKVYQTPWPLNGRVERALLSLPPPDRPMGRD